MMDATLPDRWERILAAHELLAREVVRTGDLQTDFVFWLGRVAQRRDPESLMLLDLLLAHEITIAEAVSEEPIRWIRMIRDLQCLDGITETPSSALKTWRELTPTARQLVEVQARYPNEAMSSITPDDSGVEGAVLWIQPGAAHATDAEQGPRLQVVLGTRTTIETLSTSVTVTLETAPRVLDGTLPSTVRTQVVAFIERNREVLLRHWRGELNSRQTLERLRPL